MFYFRFGFQCRQIFCFDGFDLTGPVRYRGELAHPLIIPIIIINDKILRMDQECVLTAPINSVAAARWVSSKNISSVSRMSSLIPGFLKFAVPI